MGFIGRTKPFTSHKDLNSKICRKAVLSLFGIFRNRIEQAIYAANSDDCARISGVRRKIPLLTIHQDTKCTPLLPYMRYVRTYISAGTAFEHMYLPGDRIPIDMNAPSVAKNSPRRINICKCVFLSCYRRTIVCTKRRLRLML